MGEINTREPVDTGADFPGLMRALDLIARLSYDGHLTIFAFTTNYRVMLGTPVSQEEIDKAPAGKTISEAIENCIANYIMYRAK